MEYSQELIEALVGGVVTELNISDVSFFAKVQNCYPWGITEPCFGILSLSGKNFIFDFTTQNPAQQITRNLYYTGKIDVKRENQLWEIWEDQENWREY